MFIFLCAEVTAVAMLINYISGTELWITSSITLVATLIYTLYGGLRASIFTDTIQMGVILVLLIISVLYLTSFTGSQFSFSFVNEKNPQLLSSSYIPNYTAGLTFFIAVAATNLFHQGNWQRVYAAKNDDVLKKSLIMAFIVIIPIVLFMGFSGLVAISVDPGVTPDLGFFFLLLKDQTEFLSIIIVILGLCLTISTVDTLINAISSIIVVDGKATFKFNINVNYLKFSKYFIVVLSIIAFIIASKGFSILYLFLLADLFCCAFVLTVFYSFYNKKINEKTAYFSIILGLISGFLLFPFPDFSKSLLVGIMLPIELFPIFVMQSLLFLSFLIATLGPAIVIISYDSFKGR
jgi:Na+/proline symporter